MVERDPLLTTVGDVADHDYDFCYRARGYDNSECVQYDACYGTAGWVAAEEVRTSLARWMGKSSIVDIICRDVVA